jgi:hypothetical protein
MACSDTLAMSAFANLGMSARRSPPWARDLYVGKMDVLPMTTKEVERLDLVKKVLKRRITRVKAATILGVVRSQRRVAVHFIFMYTPPTFSSSSIWAKCFCLVGSSFAREIQLR